MPPLHRDPVINHFRYKDYPMPGSLILILITIAILILLALILIFILMPHQSDAQVPRRRQQSPRRG